MQMSGDFFMSVSQKRNIFQPEASSCLLTSVSRSMLRSILLCQNSRFVLWSLRLTSQLRPCQNSPSQKTAILCPMTTKSGLPGRLLTFRRQRTPALRSSLPSRISGVVPFDLLAAMFRCRCSSVNTVICPLRK